MQIGIKALCRNGNHVQSTIRTASDDADRRRCAISVAPQSTASWPRGKNLLVAHRVALGVAKVGTETRNEKCSGRRRRWWDSGCVFDVCSKRSCRSCASADQVWPTRQHHSKCTAGLVEKNSPSSSVSRSPDSTLSRNGLKTWATSNVYQSSSSPLAPVLRGEGAGG